MFIRSGEMPSPRQTSIDKTNDYAVKSKRGALVRGSDRPSGHSVHKTTGDTGWFRLNAQNCVPGNSSRRFFELDHEILHTYSGRLYLKLEEGFLIWGFAVEISGF